MAKELEKKNAKEGRIFEYNRRSEKQDEGRQKCDNRPCTSIRDWRTKCMELDVLVELKKIQQDEVWR